jgi:hypothetical protein
VIAQIRGTLAAKVPGELIVDVGGIGYQVLIPLSVFYRLPDIGATLHLQIHTHVREDAIQLFGFQDLADKQVFLLLIGVGGIGPKLAVNILSGIAAGDLVRSPILSLSGRMAAAMARLPRCFMTPSRRSSISGIAKPTRKVMSVMCLRMEPMPWRVCSKSLCAG